MKNAISHDISHLGKRKIIFKMPFLGDMLVPWRVADLLIQTIKQTIQTIPSLISSPVFPVSCTTPKWAFCARVLAGSQKSGKLPPFTSFCGTLLEKKTVASSPDCVLLPKMAKSTFNFLQVIQAKTKRLIAMTDSCGEFTLVPDFFRFLLPKLRPHRPIFNTSEELSGDNTNLWSNLTWSFR